MVSQLTLLWMLLTFCISDLPGLQVGSIDQLHLALHHGASGEDGGVVQQVDVALPGAVLVPAEGIMILP